jgi:hypothetical protein
MRITAIEISAQIRAVVPSKIVEVVEPLFLNLSAETELVPVMNGDDLRKGLAKAAQG